MAVRQLLLLLSQTALSSPLVWEQAVLSQREGQKETMLDHASWLSPCKGRRGQNRAPFCCPVFPRSLTSTKERIRRMIS